MRIILLTLLAFLSCANFYAQDKKDSTQTKLEIDLNFDDGCGSPLVESQTYGIWKGKIVKILDDNKLVLGKHTVELLGIDSKVNKSKIRDFLNKNIINKEVLIQANLRKKNDKKIGAVVQLLDDRDDIDYINEYLLENGIAKYKPFESENLVPYYLPCRLQKAEERAKTAKLGIWAK